MKRLILILCLCLLGSGSRAAETTVFAAASLSDVLTEIGNAFNANSADKVRFSFAASSTLAKQIEAGAPVALFFSADEDWMNYVEKLGLLAPGTRRDLLTNQLVLVEPADRHSQITIDKSFDLGGLLGSGRLAMGDPDSVPAGKYGKQALLSLGVWDTVKGRVAPADSVRSALALVERGEVPLGIVYATDAAAAKSVRVAAIFPEDSHKPIVYPLALLKAQDSATARAFFAFVQSALARAAFQRYGFTLP